MAAGMPTACPRTHRRWHGLLFEISEGGSNGVSWKGGGWTRGPIHDRPYAFEPVWRGSEDGPRSGQGPGSSGWEGIPGPWCTISAPSTLHCPFFLASLKIYLAMLQRVMPPGEKYFGGTLGSEGILSLSLHHSAREGRPQGH